ncbi:uncharacterized protein L969DRAFT_17362 [Mixia osmundae IAM 14324]|uniref:Serine/threonine-protein phosphatase 2A activator n=1 Tax=Mixia osmundae (strain CBS 9802 / IAM 14324 / JCM 22182 / KY 12970) TaxID=764103 RepID=G7EA88_MIXOS|nr:uncharacterized protein L969DRAFT_17362 [Mixia osmundae IAM 14324]KEI39440.1 hypothetical protein L969DRAFT_17362 [Mixia osmundae IAM 14324]GAA99748.1 hypothetical protein E5Q_06451 [Mixia osmundae IAM 14324]
MAPDGRLLPLESSEHPAGSQSLSDSSIQASGLHEEPERALTKRVLSMAHLQVFIASPTHQQLVGFVEALDAAVVGIPLTATDLHMSPLVNGLLDLLSKVEQTIERFPAAENGGSRFGNPAFRELYDALQENITKYLLELPDIMRANSTARAELAAYLSESWGNRTRIDYGSGHELNFMCFLLSLQLLGLLTVQDHPALVLRVFWRYLNIMRTLQSTYWLEPAGSHGVWGLDDYHSLPFLFGAAQLIGHKHIKPKSIHSADIVNEYSKDYIYLSCIKFINSVKTAGLRWHSPMLDDISGVKTWEKVNSGMIKMFKAEVLAKLPVAQHIMFGTLLPFPQTTLSDAGNTVHEEGVSRDAHGHIHVRGQGIEECCGIPVPSAFAAAKEVSARTPLFASGAVKRIPFD